MKVFISWSGDRSRLLAEALRDWLPLVINAVEPWLSSVDIVAGSRWNAEVPRSLEESRFGIFCLTPENLFSPWIHFEAGAISKHVADSFVCTFLLGLTPDEVEWPLAQFQAKTVEKRHVRELLISINIATQPPLLRPDLLERSFEKWWPEFESKVKEIPAASSSEIKPQRSQESLLSEILSLLRNQERSVERSSPVAPQQQQVPRVTPNEAMRRALDASAVNTALEWANSKKASDVMIAADSDEVEVHATFAGNRFTLSLSKMAMQDKAIAFRILDQQLANLQRSSASTAE